MNNRAHAATGLLAGVATITVIGGTTGVGVQPLTLATGGLLATGAALLPDIDHDHSTITRAGGWLTRGVAEVLQALSRGVYRVTRTQNDRHSDGEHRFLLHTPAFHILVGLMLVGGGELAIHLDQSDGLTAWRWFISALLWTCFAAAIRSLSFSVPKRTRRRWHLHHRGMSALLAAAATYFLIWHGNADQHLAPVMALTVTVGMITHSLGDAATRTGIPLAWPLSIRGQRWRRLGFPTMLRFSTGSAIEHLIQWLSLTVAVLLGAAVVT